MNLRREFRGQLTRGAWQYATVESTAMGKATVRLATNGARITNCQILGADVEVGEKVVLDYSAEGAPIVRPYTIKGTQIPEEIDDTPEIEEQASTWCYAKYTMSDQTINDYGGVRDYLGDGYYGDPGFIYGSYSGQYRYTTDFWNHLPFDEAITDNIGIRTNYTSSPIANPNGYGYFDPPRGAYIVTLCVALDITTNDLTYFSSLSNFDCAISGSLTPDTGQGNQSVHVPKREHHAIWRMTWYIKYDGTWLNSSNVLTGHIRFSGMVDSSGGNIYDKDNPPFADLSKATYLKLAKDPGVYPVVEFYKVSDIGTHKTAIPYWNWENYDYPDG